MPTTITLSAALPAGTYTVTATDTPPVDPPPIDPPPVDPPLSGTNVPPWNGVAWIANQSRFAGALTNGQANFNDVFNSFGQAAALAYFSAPPSLNSVANAGNKLHPPIDQRTQSNIINAYGGQGTAGAPANMQIYSFKLAVTRSGTLTWINTDGSKAEIKLRHPQNDSPVGT